MPACVPTESTKRFARFTVYVDLADEAALLPIINARVEALATETRVIARAALLPSTAHASGDTAPPTPSARTIALLRYWQAEEADVYTREVQDTVPFMRAVECLITDKGVGDGAVTYAVYRRQMPVLSMTPLQSVKGARARPSALQHLLFDEVSTHAADHDARRAAMERFFTFPDTDGTYVSAAPFAPDSSPAAAAVVVVDTDGYPTHLPFLGSSASSVAGADQLPPPPTLFVKVLQDLYEAPEEPMEVLRRRNPLLPGILKAFHRYQNRGVVRAMLHRGYRIEVSAAGQLSTQEWVRRFVSLVDADASAVDSKMAVAAQTLKTFESHWLELPLAEREVP